MKSERLQVWRVDRKRFVTTAKTGEGARISGGRWTPPGRQAIYCGSNLELCILEILVHANTPTERSDPRVFFRITLPADQVLSVPQHRLPAGWNDPRRLHPDTIAIGARWLADSHKLALRVPSAVVQNSWNYILNPLHPVFRRVRWSTPKPLTIDPRLIDR